jgi:hypothetical protein
MHDCRMKQQLLSASAVVYIFWGMHKLQCVSRDAEMTFFHGPVQKCSIQDRGVNDEAPVVGCDYATDNMHE